jgi:hypothetical protein
MEYHHRGLPAPKKFKTKASAGKFMLTVFWNSEGVVLTDFLEKRYYSELRMLYYNPKISNKNIMRKGAEIDILLQQDNATQVSQLIPFPEVKAAVSQLFWEKEKYFFFKDRIQKLVK